MVAFFICGTPSNNDGFQFVDLGPGHLPGLPASYLDRAPGEDVEDHRFESVFVEGRRYIQYGRVLRINPNDSAANRGAYVAVGCLIGEQLPTQSVSNCVDIVSEIFGGVCSALNRARSFPVGYRFADYTYQGAPLSDRLAHQCSPLLLTDVLRQAAAQRGFVPGCRRATTHAGSRRNHRCRRRAPSALFRPRFGRVVVGRRQGARSSTRDRPSERNSSGAAGRAAERVAVLAGDHHRRRFRAHQEGSGVAAGCRRRRARGRTR